MNAGSSHRSPSAIAACARRAVGSSPSPSTCLSNGQFRQVVGDTTGGGELAAGADWIRLDYGQPAATPGCEGCCVETPGPPEADALVAGQGLGHRITSGDEPVIQP